MATRRLRTATYSTEARTRLGQAVIKAREAAGHKYRPSFARAARISPRSLEAVEQGEPTVGATVLRAVGRTLPGWTEDTPKSILEGGPIPAQMQTTERESTPAARSATNDQPGPELHNARERAVWALPDMPEVVRWSFILQLRELERSQGETG